MNKTAVLIPHYNNPQGLSASLSSIEKDEEVDILIVDDGSKEKPIEEYLLKESFKAKGQLFFIYLPQNVGIEHALNKGLQYLLDKGYKYIARLDCGDLCLNSRFAVQQRFLEQHTEIKLVGSNVKAVDTTGKFLYNMIMPETYDLLKKKMYLNCQIVHPSAMFEADIVNEIGYYPDNYKSAEDYAYFFSIMEKHGIANIQEFLVQIEINPNGISISRRKQQVTSKIRIILKHFYFGFYPVYGLLRSLLLYIIPNRFIMFLKRLLKK